MGIWLQEHHSKPEAQQSWWSRDSATTSTTDHNFVWEKRSQATSQPSKLANKNLTNVLCAFFSIDQGTSPFMQYRAGRQGHYKGNIKIYTPGADHKCWHFSKVSWHHFLLSLKLMLDVTRVLLNFSTTLGSLLYQAARRTFSHLPLGVGSIFPSPLTCIVLSRWCRTKIEPFRSSVTFLLLWTCLCCCIAQNILC